MTDDPILEDAVPTDGLPPEPVIDDESDLNDDPPEPVASADASRIERWITVPAWSPMTFSMPSSNFVRT